MGRKTGEPREKSPDTPASRTWLVSHVARAGLDKERLNRFFTVYGFSRATTTLEITFQTENNMNIGASYYQLYGLTIDATETMNFRDDHFLVY